MNHIENNLGVGKIYSEPVSSSCVYSLVMCEIIRLSLGYIWGLVREIERGAEKRDPEIRWKESILEINELNRLASNCRRSLCKPVLMKVPLGKTICSGPKP